MHLLKNCFSMHHAEPFSRVTPYHLRVFLHPTSAFSLSSWKFIMVTEKGNTEWDVHWKQTEKRFVMEADTHMFMLRKRRQQ